MKIENIDALINSINEVLRSNQYRLSYNDRKKLRVVAKELTIHKSKGDVIITDTKTIGVLISLINLLVNLFR